MVHHYISSLNRLYEPPMRDKTAAHERHVCAAHIALAYSLCHHMTHTRLGVFFYERPRTHVNTTLVCAHVQHNRRCFHFDISIPHLTLCN